MEWPTKGADGVHGRKVDNRALLAGGDHDLGSGLHHEIGAADIDLGKQVELLLGNIQEVPGLGDADVVDHGVQRAELVAEIVERLDRRVYVAGVHVVVFRLYAQRFDLFLRSLRAVFVGGVGEPYVVAGFRELNRNSLAGNVACACYKCDFLCHILLSPFFYMYCIPMQGHYMCMPRRVGLISIYTAAPRFWTGQTRFYSTQVATFAMNASKSARLSITVISTPDCTFSNGAR